MRSLIIKDIEMPQKCGQCRLFHAEHPMCCTATESHRTVGAPYGIPRPDWCPLVEVKEPHGRLQIDAKELYKYFETYDDMGGATMIVNHDLIHRGSILYAIEDAPTIIEAEGREK